MITNIGLHRVKCGSITQGIEDLMQGERAPILFSDPPFGIAMIKLFQRLNNKDTGKPIENLEWAPFAEIMFDIFDKYCSDILLIAHGKKWHDETQRMAIERGFVPIKVIDVCYKSGNKFQPMHQHIFGRKHFELPPGYEATLKDTWGYDSIIKCIGPLARPGEILLDPMCGMGYAAQAAIDTGMIFRGNELNAKRLDKTIKRLFRG